MPLGIEAEDLGQGSRRPPNCWRKVIDGPDKGKFYEDYAPKGALIPLATRGKIRLLGDRPSPDDIVAPDSGATRDAASAADVMEAPPTTKAKAAKAAKGE